MTKQTQSSFQNGKSLPTRERGVAMVIALFIVSMATLIAVSLQYTVAREVRRSANLFHAEQLQQYSVSAERASAAALELHRENKTSDDQLDLWYTTPLISPLDGGGVNGRIYDYQGCFNVNSLVDESGQPRQAQIEQYKRLLQVLELDQDLADVLRDWLDEDDIPEGSGAEDGTYLSMTPPYRTANARIVSTSELRLLSGYDEKVLEVLLPEVCALPQSQIAINVNFASVALVRSLHVEIDDSMATELVEQAREIPYTDKDDFIRHSLMEGIELPVGTVGVATDYYRAVANINVGQLQVTMESLFQRGRDGKVRVIGRGRGSL